MDGYTTQSLKMKPIAPAVLYTKFGATAGATTGALPPDTHREVDRFNVFNVADLMRVRRERPPMLFDRRAFYKISLISGRSRLEYAGRRSSQRACTSLS